MSEFYVISGVALAIDSVLALCSYIAYSRAKELLSAFKNSMNLEIDKTKIKSADHSEEPLLGIVQGTVRSLGPPIKSLHKPSVSGVIQKLTIREHSSEKRGPGFWSDMKKILDEKWSVVPFEIRNGNQKVVFTSPLKASYLNLEVIDDRFEPSIGSILNLLFGFYQKGFQYTEFILKENTMVTAFGEFVLGEKQELQLVPPRNGIRYILSTMDPETLLLRIKNEEQEKRITCIALASVGIAILGVIAFQLWRERRARLEEERRKKQLLQQRARRTANSAPEHAELTCIVCLSRSREVVLLPCGHVCLCYDCSLKLCNRPCPVCQQNVTDVHLVFIS